MKKIFFLVVMIFITRVAWSQASAYSDPVQAYNRLLIEKGGGGGYTRAGNFKVTGSPYLWGQGHIGNIYAKGETGTQITFSYNMYTQQLEITDGNKSIIKEIGEVDSFRITQGAEALMPASLLFINPVHVGSAEKAFVQVVQSGPRFSLYKIYRASLGYVSTNYVQSELRQFDINYDYYYTDAQKPGLKKLKKNGDGIKKEFKTVRDLSTVSALSDYALNPEEVLRKAFIELNK